jgi:hypothetical protein
MIEMPLMNIHHPMRLTLSESQILRSCGGCFAPGIRISDAMWPIMDMLFAYFCC